MSPAFYELQIQNKVCIFFQTEALILLSRPLLKAGLAVGQIPAQFIVKSGPKSSTRMKMILDILKRRIL